VQDMGTKKLVRAGRSSLAFIIPSLVLKLWHFGPGDNAVGWSFDEGRLTLWPVKADGSKAAKEKEIEF
jgi:hypothetical protein